jgi:hypothetical protein
MASRKQTINRVLQNILSPTKKSKRKHTHAAAVCRIFWLPGPSGLSPAVFALQAWHHQTSSYALRLTSEPEVAFLRQGTFKYGLARVLRTISKDDYATAYRRWLQQRKKVCLNQG